MESFEKYSEEFEQLILTKDFHKLEQQELKMLDAEGLNEEEYNQIRATLYALKNIDNKQELPSSKIKSNLLELFEEGASPKARIILFPNWFKISLLAAACILIGLFIVNINSDRITQSKQAYSDLNDTNNRNIYKDPLITESSINTNNKNSTINIETINLSSGKNSSDIIQTSQLNEQNKKENSEVSKPLVPNESISNVLTSGSSNTSITSNQNTSPYVWSSESNVAKNAEMEIEASSAIDESISLADFPQLINKIVTLY